MSFRYPGGFVRPGYNPLLVPNAPTIEPATAGSGSATVAFTAPSNVGGGAISIYTAISNPGQISGSSPTSPITVGGLTNGVSYTFQVLAINAYGPSDFSAASNSVTPLAPTRGVFGGGNVAGGSNVIDYVDVDTTGNATDFGDLTVARDQVCACSSSTRGVWGGGDNPASGNVMDYITIATTGNATDFGDLINGGEALGACSSSTRGLFAGGIRSGNYYNVIQYITIASTGDAIDFGDLTQARDRLAGCSSPTRGVWGGGFEFTGSFVYYNIIDYVTIASAGNATDFGDLTTATARLAACSSSTRGLFGAGYTGSSTSVISYITIASTGNATSFGNLTRSADQPAGCSSSTRGLFGGGIDAGTRQNTIDYVTIASTGNATDFGDLTAARFALGACSSGHGGL